MKTKLSLAMAAVIGMALTPGSGFAAAPRDASGWHAPGAEAPKPATRRSITSNFDATEASHEVAASTSKRPATHAVKKSAQSEKSVTAAKRKPERETELDGPLLQRPASKRISSQPPAAKRKVVHAAERLDQAAATSNAYPFARVSHGPPGRGASPRQPKRLTDGHARLTSVQSTPPVQSETIAPGPAMSDTLPSPSDEGFLDGGPMDGGPIDDGLTFDGDFGFSPNGCGDCCHDGCGVCAPDCLGPLYVRGEYLLWWLKGDSVPPLVTTSPNETSQTQAGVLGQPGTSVLFGGNPFNSNGRSGARVVMGAWLDPSARIEGEWFALGRVNTSFDQSSTGNPILARPFFNVTSGAQDSSLVAFPPRLAGSIQINETSQFLGAGLHIIENLKCGTYPTGSRYRIDYLYGFRYLRLGENLTINDRSSVIADAVPTGTQFTTFDGFRTTNNFYGANLGLMSEGCRGRWCFTTIGRLGLGGTYEQVQISGNSLVQVPTVANRTSQGGLLALPTNIGTYSHGVFTVVPQLELKLGYDLTPSLRLTFGYDVLYWSRVVRPGSQIDPVLNTSQTNGRTLEGLPAPRVTFRETDLWVQGISAGAEWRF